MVTKDRIAALKKLREQTEPAPEYTIDGAIESEVHAQINRKREKEISKGEHSLNQAHEKLERNYVFATLRGLASTRFNHPKTGEETMSDEKNNHQKNNQAI